MTVTCNRRTQNEITGMPTRVLVPYESRQFQRSDLASLAHISGNTIVRRPMPIDTSNAIADRQTQPESHLAENH